jgi:hypothetical protein
VNVVSISNEKELNQHSKKRDRKLLVGKSSSPYSSSVLTSHVHLPFYTRLLHTSTRFFTIEVAGSVIPESLFQNNNVNPSFPLIPSRLLPLVRLLLEGWNECGLLIEEKSINELLVSPNASQQSDLKASFSLVPHTELERLFNTYAASVNLSSSSSSFEHYISVEISVYVGEEEGM